MLATFITSICLLGIYSLMQQCLDAERKLTERSQAAAQARVVAAELGRAFEHLLIPKSGAGITSNVDGAGDRLVTCCVAQSASPGLAPSGEHRQYRWNGAEGKSRGVMALEVRSVPMAGSSYISPMSDAATEAPEWESIAPTTIARGLSTLSVQFRSLDATDSKWTERWKGKGNAVAVRIRATVGTETAERIVVPRVNAPLSSEGGEQGS